MKIAKYLSSDGEGWGAISPEEGIIRPIAAPFEEWAPAVTASGPGQLSFGKETIKVSDVKLLAPLHKPAHIYWVGLTYPNWPKTPGSESPVFFKSRKAIVGPDDTIHFPALLRVQPGAYFVYEIELVAVIGSHGLGDQNNGITDVLGYTIGNSGAVRGQRTTCVGTDLMGRSSGRKSSAIGPWIVTRDELGGDQHPDLLMTMRVNGEVRQRSRTSRMEMDMNRLLYEVDYRSKLVCGDVIETGTPGYIGVQDGLYNASDRTEAEIEGIGVLRNQVEDEDPYSIHPSQRITGPRSAPPFYPYPVADEVL